jgi:hypothetical protein
MDEYDDFGCDDYFETHDSDDLMEWEEEQVFQDSCLDREEDWDCGYDCDGSPIGG